jgi:hypothetical protein
MLSLDPLAGVADVDGLAAVDDDLASPPGRCPRLSEQLSSQASFVPVGLGGFGLRKVTEPDQSYCAEPPA